MGKGMVLLSYVTIFVIIVLLVQVLKEIKMQNPSGKQYDERQILIQGKAYKYAFFTLLSYFIGIGIVSLYFENEFATTYVYTILGTCLGLIVFVTYSVFKDAYIGMKNNINTSIGCAFLTGICNTAAGMSNRHTMIVEGVLQNSIGQLAIGVTLLYVGLILIAKKLIDQREM